MHSVSSEPSFLVCLNRPLHWHLPWLRSALTPRFGGRQGLSVPEVFTSGIGLCLLTAAWCEHIRWWIRLRKPTSNARLSIAQGSRSRSAIITAQSHPLRALSSQVWASLTPWLKASLQSAAQAISTPGWPSLGGRHVMMLFIWHLLDPRRGHGDRALPSHLAEPALSKQRYARADPPAASLQVQPVDRADCRA